MFKAQIFVYNPLNRRPTVIAAQVAGFILIYYSRDFAATFRRLGDSSLFDKI
jgi:hypothetical protein